MTALEVNEWGRFAVWMFVLATAVWRARAARRLPPPNCYRAVRRCVEWGTVAAVGATARILVAFDAPPASSAVASTIALFGVAVLATEQMRGRRR